MSSRLHGSLYMAIFASANYVLIDRIGRVDVVGKIFIISDAKQLN